MVKKIAKLLFAFLFLFLMAIPVLGQDREVNIYFFWGEGCPHCAHEKPFLEELEKKYSEVKVHDFEVWNNSNNRKLLIEVGKKLNTNVSGVPFTVVGEQYFTGWLNEEITGKSIESAVQCVLKDGCRDVVGEVLASQQPPKVQTEKPYECEEEQKSAIPSKINLPIVGEINTKNLSLPLLTIILGGLDGFNPCAMWTLLFLISLLLDMKDRKRRWILGTAFIAASAFVYFLFMSAWLNLFLFLGFVLWVRIIIGLVALAAGGYNLREYVVNKEGGCPTTEDEKREKIFEKIKNITQKKQFIFALVGIILLAFAVNLVELVCSAGLPAIYTQILALTNLPRWQYYFYLLFYILVFMADDLFVFFVAMTTLQAIGIESKYARVSRLIGGILMLIIGILLLLKPEVLMFG